MAGESSKKPRLLVPVNDRDHIQGPANAKVTLVEYGDYQCPHCRLVYHNIKALQRRLGDRLRYVYRHLPIDSMHPDARLAAEAAEAAGTQGKFWEMHDQLYDHSDIGREQIITYAEAIGLDMARFLDDLDQGRYREKVQEDFDGGIRSGVNGTPTFFINGQRYDGAWDTESLIELVQKPLGVRVRLLGEEFTRRAASGGIILLICTLIALIWRNSGAGDSYVEFWETYLSINLGPWELKESLLHWINDGLMVIFFFVVGLEIKRELTTGELASPKKAALPIAGAIGGMFIPAAIFMIFNLGGPAQDGWGIPMATDIAFTLGILAMFGSRIPFPVKVFFTAMAIADDLGAILVIALFYSADISLVALGVAAGFLVALIGLNRARVYSPIPYAVLGVGLWLAFLESGIHPTIAGVLLAATIPSRSPANLRAMLAQVISLLQSFELPTEWREHPDSRRQAAVSTLEEITERMQTPAQRLEELLTPWTTYLILPLFALANAGVAINSDSLGSLTGRLSLGIIFGLVIGKPLGISLISYLAYRLGLATLPGGVSWPQFISAGMLAGIGFTMSLFIASAAFSDPALAEASKLAILVASIVAAVSGVLLLNQTSPNPDAHSEMIPVASGKLGA